ncbi:MAG: hypothetical protein K0Q72_584 [Armatimonadetes bacterium]|jgi:hypothetical protein|nr:hypothetical protein [Armatimonadota bacterium]
MPTKHKPELHQPALDLIQTVYTAHQAGAGALSLLELARTFSGSLSAADEEKLRQRGNLELAKTDAGGGTFRNEGAEVTRKDGEVTVSIPPLIQGNYTASPEACKLAFDGNHTILGKVKIVIVTVTAKLRSVSIDQREIFVDTDKDQGDLRIIHG